MPAPSHLDQLHHPAPPRKWSRWGPRGGSRTTRLFSSPLLPRGDAIFDALRRPIPARRSVQDPVPAQEHGDESESANRPPRFGTLWGLRRLAAAGRSTHARPHAPRGDALSSTLRVARPSRPYALRGDERPDALRPPLFGFFMLRIAGRGSRILCLRPLRHDLACRREVLLPHLEVR